jgi:hypothetical protein
VLVSEVSLHASERTDDETIKHMWKSKADKKSSRFLYENTIEELSTMKRSVPDPNVILGQETGYLNFFVVVIIVVRYIGVDARRCKPGGCGFKFRLGHWDFLSI